MAPIPKKTVRKLVTLPLELAERVEKFRQSSGASSESDALKALVEDGLKLRDTRDDLFERCEAASANGQSIGDIINLVTSDHPLVESTTLDGESLLVNLTTESDEAAQRFRYARSTRKWLWEWRKYEYSEFVWVELKKDRSGKRSTKNSSTDDDEIPF